MAVVLDEFQQVIREGGEAERQLQAAIQRHRHVAYVFAGSRPACWPTSPAILAALSGSWASGSFSAPFLAKPSARSSSGIFLAGFTSTPEGVERILDLSEDVPYNVAASRQRLLGGVAGLNRPHPYRRAG